MRISAKLRLSMSFSITYFPVFGRRTLYVFPTNVFCCVILSLVDIYDYALPPKKIKLTIVSKNS